MDPLNYSTHAIDDLLATSKTFVKDMPLSARNFVRITELLKQAVKFHLPDNGELFADAYRALPAVFRLPYPVIAAEFSIAKEASPAHQPMALRGEQTVKSSRRIALAVEINEDNFATYSWMLPEEKHDILTTDGSIAVISVFFIDDQNRWSVPPLGVVIPARKIDGPSDLLAGSEVIFGGELPKGMKHVPLEMHPTYLMPEYVKELQADRGVDHIMATVVQDNQDESRAILELVEALSCNNVTTDTVPAPKSLNKKREAKGKAPFFEYKVLILDVPSVSGRSIGQGGTHASPRVHLRRGHIRRLPGKNVWVNATVVGNRKMGLVVKDYSINPTACEADDKTDLSGDS